ncbi:MAG: hypothetical protein AB1510_01835 [Bacillota bacterium]
MVLKLFKMLLADNTKLREFDPATIQRIDEGSNLSKAITETQVSARKCHYYAGNAVDPEVAKFFNEEAQKLTKGARALQNYYEGMTRE